MEFLVRTEVVWEVLVDGVTIHLVFAIRPLGNLRRVRRDKMVHLKLIVTEWVEQVVRLPIH